MTSKIHDATAPILRKRQNLALESLTAYPYSTSRIIGLLKSHMKEQNKRNPANK